MLPAGAKLVSLGPVDHRFIYFYDEDVREDRWPMAVSDLSEDVDYFCFTRDTSDTPESRASGRGRRWTTTPGTLPFVWEEVATMLRRTPSERQPADCRFRPRRATARGSENRRHATAAVHGPPADWNAAQVASLRSTLIFAGFKRARDSPVDHVHTQVAHAAMM